MGSEVIRATNSKGDSIEFSIKTTDAGPRNVIGSSVNIIYRGSLGDTNLAIKRTQITPGAEAAIVQAAKASEASYYLSSHFTGCKPIFNCFYGTVINPEYLGQFKKTIFFTPSLDAIYTSDQIGMNEIYYLYELINGDDVNKLLIRAKANGTDINYRKYGLQFIEALTQMRNTQITIGKKTATTSIVHLDLKPANLMIEKESDTLKIIDLNTICISAERLKCKRNSMSFPYSGPETFPDENSPALPGGKNSHEVLMASDIFAAGMTLYEMITNTKAIDVETPLEWRAFWRDKVPVGSEVDLVFPQDKMIWKPLIQKMVRRDYRERPKSADVLKEFNKILDVKEKSGGARKPTKRRTRRR